MVDAGLNAPVAEVYKVFVDFSWYSSYTTSVRSVLIESEPALTHVFFPSSKHVLCLAGAARKRNMRSR